MNTLGIEEIETWDGITTFYFACGCDMSLQDDGELADTLHSMCHYHHTGELDS